MTKNNWKEDFKYDEAMKQRYENLLRMLKQTDSYLNLLDGKTSVLDLGCGP